MWDVEREARGVEGGCRYGHVYGNGCMVWGVSVGFGWFVEWVAGYGSWVVILGVRPSGCEA